MEPTSIPLGGGATAAAPGSSPACDVCGATDETKVEEGVRYCKPCWLDEEFPAPTSCDSCGCSGATHEWEADDRVTSKVYHYCDTCWFDVQDSVDELLALNVERVSEYVGGCDDCGVPYAFTAEYWHKDGRTLHLCERCYQSADDSDDYLEPIPKVQALECDDCKQKPATETFNHLDSRSFKLCGGCFSEADHEEDYGASFGSAPRLRTNGKVKFCECPLPCDFVEPTRCELCKGVVVVSG